jgi:hypothetical protein
VDLTGMPALKGVEHHFIDIRGAELHVAELGSGPPVDAVLDGFDSYAPRFADPARARAAQQVYRTFQLYEYPAWLRGRYRDRRLTTPTLGCTAAPIRSSRRRSSTTSASTPTTCASNTCRNAALPAGGATGARHRARAGVLRLLMARGHQPGV